MKKPTLVKDYSKLNDSKLDVKAEEIIAQLTGNLNFPTTVPTIAEFTALKESYTNNLIASGMGDKGIIALKNQSKLALLDGMRFLAINLESQAMGNRAKMVSTGMDLASEGENVPALTAPTNFKLSDGVNSGELKSDVKRVPQATAYSHEYSLLPPDENTVWVPKMVSTKEFTFSDLPVGTRVYVRVAAIGRKSQIAYTGILSRIVQ